MTDEPASPSRRDSHHGSLTALCELRDKVRGLEKRVDDEILRRQYHLRLTETGSGEKSQ